MAIGTGLALLGSAAIGAVGSAIGSSKQSKALRQANQITQEDNAANRAFATQIYGQNAARLDPYAASGLQANNAFMELLGFPAAQPAFASFGPAPMSAPSAFGGYGVPEMVNDYGISAFSPLGRRNLSNGFYGGSNGDFQGFPGGTIPANVAPPPAAPSARSAFDTYRGSTGYDFRFNEGIRSLQSAFSRNLESGAAQKAAIRFGQGIASDEFSRYMDLLRGQSQLGLSGASALAGVSQNFANTVTAGNQAAATAAANARLYSGSLAQQNWANIGSSFGSALGYFAK